MSVSERPKLDYNLILEAIDALKARKARPDKTRICHHLERKWGFPRNDVLVVLSCAVRDGAVLKVKYKDYYSYRNPEKPSRSVQKRVVTVESKESCNSSNSSSNASSNAACSGSGPTAPRPLSIRRIIAAIKREIKSDAKSSHGASVPQILSALHSKKQLLKYDETLLEKILRKEVQTGHSIRSLSNGRYTLTSSVSRKDTSESKDGEQTHDEDYAETDASSDYEEEPIVKHAVNGYRFGNKRRFVREADRVEPSSSVRYSDKRMDEQTVQRARPISQRKKIKKSLGPDFLDPSDLGYQYLRDTYEPKCHYCSLPGSNARQEKLISCTKCGFKVHPSCCKSENELEPSPSGDLLCCNCKPVCGLCKRQSSPTESLICCVECEESFHVQCVGNTSNLDVKSKGGWFCQKCSELEPDELSVEDAVEVVEATTSTNSSPEPDFVNGVDSESCSSITPEKRSSTDIKVEEAHEEEEEEAEAEVEAEKDKEEDLPSKEETGTNGFVISLENKCSSKDPSEWTVDDVVDFIGNIGFPDQAPLFKEQEIDGRSLLLLKRMDVLTGLSIKLGPALKIYAHIFHLQGTKMAFINPFIPESNQLKRSDKAAVSISSAS